MRVVFMGTPEFAVRQLQAILEAGHEVALVVTAPERPAGRGRKMTPSEVAVFAGDAGLEVITPEDVNAPEVIERIAGTGADVAVVAAFGQKLGKTLLETPKRGCFNVHASLLPKYRGAAPINYALINGDEETGVTIQSVAMRMDAGSVAAQEAIRIEPTWNAEDLRAALAEMGARQLVAVLARLETGTLELAEQPREGITKAPRLSKDDGIIDWNRSAREVHNLVRGVTPWPGARSWHGESPETKLELQVLETEVVSEDGHAGEPGEVAVAGEAGIEVACGRGVLRILRLKPAGKRPMSAAEFVRGYRWNPGERLTEKS